MITALAMDIWLMVPLCPDTFATLFMSPSLMYFHVAIKRVGSSRSYTYHDGKRGGQQEREIALTSDSMKR